ncbi:alanine racemase [Sphingosinicella microcystinivorans]|uniref:alanine racemase n=1 Tax=Sphingosinicella microcystinivorans TaxID=335406 RepID=UPI0022F3E4FE|nr:alanine racemase [Sphingosinicella microcystinivorans]WBX82541.1 alanine racemase [Sphingosinicella microcystinivorans]
MIPPSPLRLRIDMGALAANWRQLRALAGVDAGAAVKANGYGLGAKAVVDRLHAEGCRTVYVSNWQEAAALAGHAPDLRVKVLHGVDAADLPAALSIDADPVLVSPEQVALWRAHGAGRRCDVMVDTGMNRLGFEWRGFCTEMFAGLDVDTVHSHLACADTPEHPLNAVQRDRFAGIASALGARGALANTAGILLGCDYAFGHVRPGIGLYGGMGMRQVVFPQARVIQCRDVPAGDCAGYGATWTARRDSRLAVLNVGYADGYLRAFSNRGAALVDGRRAPVVGRVSMDMIIIDVTDTPVPVPGDRVDLAYDLAEAAAQSGLSEYELLTGLGARYERVYV